MDERAATPGDRLGSLTAEEIGALLGREIELLRRFVRRRTGKHLRSREGVSDLVQSTLREVIHDRKDLSFSNSAALQAHVYQVAARKLLSKGRFHSAAKRELGREERIESFDEDEPALTNSRSSPSGVAARREELDRLRAAIDALEPRDRQILVLRKLLGVSTNEIASELKMAESTVRWRLGVVLTTLAVRLGGDSPDH